MKTVTLEDGVRILKAGGILVYPTDTAWGVGCRIDNADAVKRLYAIRNRPQEQALPVLVPDRKTGLSLFRDPSPLIRHLTLAWWPGDCTVVGLADLSNVTSFVRGGSDTVGVRIPNHKTTDMLLKGLGIPIAGTSANVHGKATPYKRSDLDHALLSLVDGVIGEGEVTTPGASSVIDATVYPPRIIREGRVSALIAGYGAGSELWIDSTGIRTFNIALFTDSVFTYSTEGYDNRLPEPLLVFLEQLLSRAGTRISDIRRITVEPGPGSFTGIRIGMAVGRTVALLNGCTVNGCPPEQPIPIVYGKSAFDS